MKRVILILLVGVLVVVCGFIVTDAAMVELTNQPRVISLFLSH
jgi:hypothetical protein